jgi:hypothetical protein
MILRFPLRQFITIQVSICPLVIFNSNSTPYLEEYSGSVVQQFGIDVDVSGVNFQRLRVNVERFLILSGHEFLITLLLFGFQ